jgi:hypothetical protein
MSSPLISELNNAYYKNDIDKLSELITANYDILTKTDILCLKNIAVKRLFSDSVDSQNYTMANIFLQVIDRNFMNHLLSMTCDKQSSLAKDTMYNKVKYFLENGANPNIGNSIYHQRTPLHFTTEMYQYNWKYNMDISMVERLSSLLLEYGADPNQQCNLCTESTPWQNMAFSKNIKLIKIFLEKGADPMFYIIRNERIPEQCKDELLLYHMSVQYNDMIKKRHEANKKVYEMVNRKLYTRVGGINLLQFF